MRAVALGILSTARINEQILRAAGISASVRVVAVASRDAARARAYASAHGVERAHASYDALLADPEVDAVYVSLPNSLHVEWSVRALEAGKHVLCEKPLSGRAAAVERAFDAADRAQRLLAEAFMYRHHPQTSRVKQLVAGGAIGRLRAIRAVFSFDLLRSRGTGDVRLRPDLDGGALMDVGCYCVSGARLLAGEPERACGERVSGETGVDVDFHGTLRFTGDVVAQFHASFALPLRQELEAVGDEGSLLVQAPWRVDYGGDVLLRRGADSERVHVEQADAYRLQLENFAAAIRGEAAPLLGRDDAVGQARSLEALSRAAETGVAADVGAPAPGHRSAA